MLNEPKQMPVYQPLVAMPKDNVPASAAQPSIMESAQLFAGRNEVWIEYHGEIYRLQQTKIGKLLLTK